MIVRPALLAGVVAVALSGVPVAHADAYPPNGVRVVQGQLSPTRATSGEPVTVSGDGFAGASVVRTSLDGRSTGALPASADGHITYRFSVRAPGSHVVALSGLEQGGRVRVVSATLTVMDGSAAKGPAGQGSARTGTDLVPALGGGFGGVAAGTGLILLGRARRRRASLR